MRDITQFVRLIKQTALDAVKASNPSEIRYGTVIKEKPLEIRIDQKIVLNDSHLILTRNVKNYETSMSINSGAINIYQVHNGLKNGEKVLLIREQGGKKYIVVDRV